MIGDLRRLGIRAKRSQRFTLAFVCRALCFFVFVPWMPSLKEAYVFFEKFKGDLCENAVGCIESASRFRRRLPVTYAVKLASAI